MNKFFNGKKVKMIDCDSFTREQFIGKIGEVVDTYAVCRVKMGNGLYIVAKEKFFVGVDDESDTETD